MRVTGLQGYRIIGGLFLALVIAGCSGVPSWRPADIDLHLESPHMRYVVFAFQQGDVTVALNDDNPATKRLIEAATQGYYNGAFVYDRRANHYIRFGEAYWQGREPSPRWLVESTNIRRTGRLRHGQVAVPILAQVDDTHMIIGPQLLMVTNYNINQGDMPGNLLPVGTVVRGEDVLKTVMKGDKVISAVEGVPVAK
jgi:hypothetical protein